MKKFTKLALAASVALSANAMAMQAMDDSTLSATTGQDGINIGIGISKVEIGKLYVHDNDGYESKGVAAKFEDVDIPEVTVGGNVIPGRTESVMKTPSTVGYGGEDSGEAGAIAINGITVTANKDSLLDSHNLADIKIDSSGSSDGAFLNIAAEVSGLNIEIGAISVARSNSGATVTAANSIRRGIVDGTEKAILSGLTITTGKMDANVQLGSTPQGAMIRLDTTMTGGLTISDLGILDNAGGGQITLGKIQVADAEDKNLKIKSDIGVTLNGLEITSRHADDFKGTDIYIQGINLGAAAIGDLDARGRARAGSIGDVEIQGLKTWHGTPTALGGTGQVLGSVIKISGR